MAVVHINKDNFEELVLKNEKTVLLDFWATWCGPCRMVAPIVHEIADEREDIVVGKINVDEQPDLARMFNIASIPTLVVIKNAEVTNTGIGFMPKEKETNPNYEAWKKQRGDWGNISPVTKIIPNKKKNPKIKHKGEQYDEV